MSEFKNSEKLQPRQFDIPESKIPVSFEISSNLKLVQDFVLTNSKKLLTFGDPTNIILTGDCLSCCDEAALAKNNQGEIVGVCTLSPRGEGSPRYGDIDFSKEKDPDEIMKKMKANWQPTIVGRSVLPEYRRKGIGTGLYLTAINRMLERMEKGEIPQKKILIEHVSVAARNGMRKLLSQTPGLEKVIDSQNRASFDPMQLMQLNELCETVFGGDSDSLLAAMKIFMKDDQGPDSKE